jgi:hypothetical protein
MPSSRQAALREVAPTDNGNGHGGSVALRYVARAGLLPELSRQTYDSFPKAIREAVLNALDADATEIDVDFSQVAGRRQMTVADNGAGMSLRDFCEQFMSLGGSSRFGDEHRFGRIGIGSLALLQYAEAATVMTKHAGATTVTEARIQHPWKLDRRDRRARLGELAAGFAEEVDYDGPEGDHFTRITLENVAPEVWSIGQDPGTFYKLIDGLRRILPLPWHQGRLAEVLKSTSPELLTVLQQHVDDWSASVRVHSEWERGIELCRRSFGDDGTGVEDWNGPPVPLLKSIRVPGDGRRREITIAGYLLNQKRAHAEWSGLTARVQNVAVEEHTFFDVTADPGFRKYISGEVWLLGEIDRERLINIDRSSFNRECADYQAVQRLMSRAIVEFKSQCVQRPQRQKVAVRRLLENHVQSLKAVEKVANRAAGMAKSGTLPSSERGRSLTQRWSLVEALREASTDLVIDETRGASNRGYDLDLSDDGLRVKATVGPGLMAPTIRVGDLEYSIEYAVGGAEDPPVVIRNRPRRIIFNTGHPAHRVGDRATKFDMSLALELAYLVDGSDAATVYETMLGFLEVL